MLSNGHCYRKNNAIIGQFYGKDIDIVRALLSKGQYNRKDNLLLQGQFVIARTMLE